MKYLLLTICTLSTLFSLGQSTAFNGIVVDTTGAKLDMVSVAVLSSADSTVESFTFSNPDGSFVTDRLSRGEYVLQLSFLGYANYTEVLKVGANGTPANRGNIVMVPKLNVLSEVVINGQRIPVLINKDTVEYNAAAFRVRPEDNVEDLLKRLPGIDVDRDGTITAQGQEVKQVLVDGKVFFGGDPTVATKNIPADAVKNVQVYDRQTEDAKFTGVDDGERTKTINLELKEDKKNGYFGYVEGGAGLADVQTPFKAKGGVHSFTGTTRLSILTNVNNVNDYGFSYGDYMDMAGAASGGRGSYSMTFSDNGMPMSWGSPNNGQYLSGAGGLNFNWDPNTSHKFNASYFFTHLDNFTRTIQNSEEFLGDRTIYGYRNSEDYSISNRHSFSLSHRSDLDSSNRISISAEGSYQGGFSNSTTFESRSLDTSGVLQLSNRSANSTDMNVSSNTRLNFIHKFQTTGRLLSFNGYVSSSDRESNGEWRNVNQFPIEGLIDSLNQNRNDNTSNTSISGSVIYTEPLAKNHFIEGSYTLGNNVESLNRMTYDASSGGFLDIYSPNFNLVEKRQTGKLAYRYTGESHNLDIGVKGNLYKQNGVEERFSTTLPNRNYAYTLPYIDYNWDISTFSRFGFDYSTNVVLPKLNQLLTLVDITNPLVKYEGNPNLTPEYEHDFWINYGRWNSFDGSGFFAYISANVTDNVISTDQTIDSNYVRIFKPLNYSQKAYNANASVNYRYTIKRLGMSMRIRMRGGFSSNPNSLNGEINIQRGSNVGGELGFRNTNQEVFGYSFGGNWNYNWSFYSLQEKLNQEYLTHSYYLNLEWSPGERFGMESGVNVQTFANTSFADQQFVPVWNANVHYNFLKEGTAQLQLTIFDILNQNKGINRYATLNSIVQSQTNSLGRYVMLTFLYKFSSVGGGGQGGDSHIGHRRH